MYMASFSTVLFLTSAKYDQHGIPSFLLPVVRVFVLVLMPLLPPRSFPRCDHKILVPCSARGSMA